MLIKIPVWLVMFVAALATTSVAAGPTISVVWVRMSDFPLRTCSLADCSKSVLLYGHNVGGSFLIPSPGGDRVAADVIPDGGFGLFSVSKPGVRRTVPRFSPDREAFLGAWSRDGKGMLTAKLSSADSEDTYQGTYIARLDGHRRLLAKPHRGDLMAPTAARYSPTGKSLAILADNWLQVLDTRTGRTRLFSDRIQSQTGIPVWLDDNRLVYQGSHDLWLADIGMGSVKPWVKSESADSLVCPKARGRLYVVMSPSLGSPSALYAVSLATGQREQVVLSGFAQISRFLGITSDGRHGLVVGRADGSSEEGKPAAARYGVWVVDMDTGAHNLVDKDSIMAAFVERDGKP